MSFHDAMFSSSGWVIGWFYWLGMAMVLTPIILAFSKDTRRDALIVLVVNAVVVVTMGWLYEQMGYVRMLGIIHVIFWTPLLVYLWRRAKTGEMALPFRLVMWLFVASLLVSLGFDYIDVARYIMGERASMI